MVKIYFAGQDNFGNRGCEALIRSNIKTIRLHIQNAEFIVPSKFEELDKRQWKNSDVLDKVTFVEPEPFPFLIKLWGKARKFFKSVEYIKPRYFLTQNTSALLSQSDAVIMTGGDIISLDYGLESLYYWVGICEKAINLKKTTILWAASVGPFTANAHVEKHMKHFLARFTLITVREKASYDYLSRLGLKNIEMVIDPAFALDPEKYDTSSIGLLNTENELLGFNISPLIGKFRLNDQSRDDLDNEIIEFIKQVIDTKGVNVMLIPHVDPLNGANENSDSHYMKAILDKLRALGYNEKKIDILPRTLNAAELKYVISKCDYFMGARTHATVAALSQHVPTTSIAYSIKAKGINFDLFGHNKYVLETPKISLDELNKHFDLLVSEKKEIKQLLEEKIPLWKTGAEKSAVLFRELLPK